MVKGNQLIVVYIPKNMKFETNNFHLDNENLQGKKKKKNFSITLIAFSFLVITISTSSFGFFDNNPTRSMNVLAQTQEPGNNDVTDDNPLALSTLIKQGSPFYGNETAPITIIDFSDFQCPMCKRHVDNTEQQINSTMSKMAM